MTIRLGETRRRRDELLRDGELIAVDETVLRALDVPWSVACTQRVFADCIRWTTQDTEQQVVADSAGRQWDLLVALRAAVQNAQRHATRRRVVPFTHERIPRDGAASSPEPVELIATIDTQNGAQMMLTVDHAPGAATP